MKKHGNRYKEDKPNVFQKAFEWYTKDRCVAQENTEQHVLGFASWLDARYLEYSRISVNDPKFLNKKSKDNNDREILTPNDQDLEEASNCICDEGTDKGNTYSKNNFKRRKRNYNRRNSIQIQRQADGTGNKDGAALPPNMCKQGAICCSNLNTINVKHSIVEVEPKTEANKTPKVNISTQTSNITASFTNNDQKVVKKFDQTSQTVNNSKFMVTIM